jgi:hypothetical protein
MSQRFKLLPWTGGLNSSDNYSSIPQNQLSRAENYYLDQNGARVRRPTLKANWMSGTKPIDNSTNPIGIHEFVYGTSSKTRVFIVVDGKGNVYSVVPSTGVSTQLTVAGTAWSTSLTSCSMVTFNNRVFIAVGAGTAQVMKMYSGTGNVEDVTGSPPSATALGVWQGRLFCNNPADLDRLYYSETYDHTKWSGAGDSGAIELGVGDGNLSGITCITDPLKGDLYIGKTDRIYRIPGGSNDPAFWTPILISSSIGIIGPNAFALIDQDDLVFASNKGLHSMATTVNYGDVMSTYISYDVQDEFFASGATEIAYHPDLSSVAMNIQLTGQANPDTKLYLYNFRFKQWSTWSFPANNSYPIRNIMTATDSGQTRFYVALQSAGTLAKFWDSASTDTDYLGTSRDVTMRLTTGHIIPAQEIGSVNAFKSIRLFVEHVASGSQSITLTFSIDALATASENTFTITDDYTTSTSDYKNNISVPIFRSLVGTGYGFILDVQTTSNIVINGFEVEFEGGLRTSDQFIYS